MTIALFAFEVVCFVCFLFLRFPNAIKIFLPLASLIMSTFAVALASKVGLIAQVASGFSAIGVSFILADLVKHRFGLSSHYLRDHSGASIAIITILLLGLILIVHNIASIDVIMRGGEAISVANPWGILTVLMVILFTILNKSAFQDGSFDDYMFYVTSFASVILGFLEFAVILGIIPGNTSKVFGNLGGRGLANWSTNETAILSCSLLIWNIRSLFKGRMSTFIAGGCAILNLIVVLLTKGRIALAVASMLIITVFLAGNAKTWLKLSVILPVAFVFAVFARNVIVQRTAAEFADKSKILTSLQDSPGSGRLVIWFYYVDAFIYSARSHPYLWIVGCGVPGLLTLYDLSALQSLGEVMDRVRFLPLHSDLVTVLLISGILGLMCWIYVIWWFWRVPKARALNYNGLGAIGAFTVFMAVDMMNYLLVATILIFYAVVSSIDLTKFSLFRANEAAD